MLRQVQAREAYALHLWDQGLSSLPPSWISLNTEAGLELEYTELFSMLESLLSILLISYLCDFLCCLFPGGSCPAPSIASVQPKCRKSRSQHSWQQVCASYNQRGTHVQEVPSALFDVLVHWSHPQAGECWDLRLLCSVFYLTTWEHVVFEPGISVPGLFHPIE